MRKSKWLRFLGEKPPAAPAQAETGWDQNNLYTLSVHNTDFSKDEVVVNSDIFKPLEGGAMLEIELCEETDRTPGTSRRLAVQVAENASKDVGKHIQISLIKAIADLFGIDKKARARVKKLASADPYAIKSVGISFRDAFFSRRDMGLIERFLKTKKMILYENKAIDYAEQSFRIRSIKLRNPGQSHVGIADANTKFRYYSRSCRAFWIIELSKELWEMDNDGHMLYERVVEFIGQAFEQFRAHTAAHKITFLAAGRLFFPFYDFHHGAGIDLDESGRLYTNFFHNILTVQSFKGPMLPVLSQLKRSIAEYPSRLNWTHNRNPHIRSPEVPAFGNFAGIPLPQCELSDSKDFCLLEALNVCYNEFNILGQQSLDLTGKQVLVISPGSGIYNVSPEMANNTKHRFTNLDCGVDLFAFGYPPMHIVPLFSYRAKDQPLEHRGARKCMYPHWISLCFIHRNLLDPPADEAKRKLYPAVNPTQEGEAPVEFGIESVERARKELAEPILQPVRNDALTRPRYLDTFDVYGTICD